MLTETAIGLQRRGFKQRVVSLHRRGPYADELEAAGIPVSAFDIASICQGLSVLGKLSRVVRQVEPDLIQGWMYHGDLAATLAHLITPGRKRRKLFWNIRASNVDDKRYARLVRACAWFSRWPDVVVANSEAGARFHAARGYRARRIVTISNGIDSEKFRPDPAARSEVRAELGLGSQVVAVHVARVDPMKDHATFLAAMARLPDVSGLLIGMGTEALNCSPNVRALGVRSNPERFYAAADLVVSSSAFGEGFSNALAEGMSAGLVPVATDVGDAMRIVGPTGNVVAPRDPAALAAAIRSEAELSPDQRRNRGQEARARIVSLFDRERAIVAYAALYREFGAARS